jgi:hypothetical protein
MAREEDDGWEIDEERSENHQIWGCRGAEGCNCKMQNELQ